MRIFLAAALLSLAAAAAEAGEDCMFQDVDALGLNIGDGRLNQKDSAEECRESCQSDPRCNFFVWVEPTFFDPLYRLACWHKANVEEVLSQEGAVFGTRDCPPGGEENTGDDSPCCDSLRLSSLGLSSFDQGDRLGNYEKVYTDANGRNVYQQVGGDQFLYFLTSGVWMVGDEPGVDLGGVLNRNFGECPEALETDWEYYSWYGTWEEDLLLEAACTGGGGGGGGDEHEYEECNQGYPACGDCTHTASQNGVLYCCSTGCNSGGIETWSEGADVHCRCWHD